jgi:hypothetical protein
MKPLPENLPKIRLGEYYAKGLVFRALCPKCASDRQVPPKHILDTLGPEWYWSEDRMKDLATRLRLKCGTCGNKQGISVRVVRE